MFLAPYPFSLCPNDRERRRRSAFNDFLTGPTFSRPPGWRGLKDVQKAADGNPSSTKALDRRGYDPEKAASVFRRTLRPQLSTIARLS